VRLLYGSAVFYLVFGGAELAVFTESSGRRNWFALGLGAWMIFMALFMGLLSWRQAQKRRHQLQQRRDQPSTDDAEPAVPPEIWTMVEQGEKIKAIKRYRQLNPGVGLKEAKNVIDGL
jgi:ABC-type transport system involved in cytochrome bd biosynthesis fused ATPase/permease subunit